jgi:hypothetical protein
MRTGRKDKLRIKESRAPTDTNPAVLLSDTIKFRRAAEKMRCQVQKNLNCFTIFLIVEEVSIPQELATSIPTPHSFPPHWD